MDQRRFDDLIMNLTVEPSSRRSTLLIGAGMALAGLLGQAGFGVTTADAAACRKVQQPCRRPRQCCSGLCRGKRGKKTCRGHGAGTCKQQRQHLLCTAPDITLSLCNADRDCACVRTTSGTNYCGDFFHPSDCTTCSECAVCKRDADCVRQGFPPGSACIPTTAGRCNLLECERGTMCVVRCGTVPRP